MPLGILNLQSFVSYRLKWVENPSITSIDAVLIYIILIFTGADFDDYTKNVVAKNLLKKGSNEKHSRDFGRFR